MYELPSVVSRGDFHIFVNTALFDVAKYVARFDVAIPRRRSGREIVPNLLCRLFVHWSRDVRGYLHQVLVWRVAIRWEMKKELSVETPREPLRCNECSWMPIGTAWAFEEREKIMRFLGERLLPIC